MSVTGSLLEKAAQFGTGVQLQTDDLTAWRLVARHLGAKPKRYVAQPDGSWTVRGIERADLVLEFIPALAPELRVRSFVEHHFEPFVLAEWVLLRAELEAAARKAGIPTGEGRTRRFARARQLSATSWRWLPVD